nr:hypothetical protein [Lentzea guizhouensis]
MPANANRVVGRSGSSFARISAAWFASIGNAGCGILPYLRTCSTHCAAHGLASRPCSRSAYFSTASAVEASVSVARPIGLPCTASSTSGNVLPCARTCSSRRANEICRRAGCATGLRRSSPSA